MFASPYRLEVFPSFQGTEKSTQKVKMSLSEVSKVENAFDVAADG